MPVLLISYLTNFTISLRHSSFEAHQYRWCRRQIFQVSMIKRLENFNWLPTTIKKINTHRNKITESASLKFWFARVKFSIYNILLFKSCSTDLMITKLIEISVAWLPTPLVTHYNTQRSINLKSENSGKIISPKWCFPLATRREILQSLYNFLSTRTLLQQSGSMKKDQCFHTSSFQQAITLKYTQSHTLVSEKKYQILNPHYNFSQFGNELSQIVLTWSDDIWYLIFSCSVKSTAKTATVLNQK